MFMGSIGRNYLILACSCESARQRVRGATVAPWPSAFAAEGHRPRHMCHGAEGTTTPPRFTALWQIATMAVFVVGF